MERDQFERCRELVAALILHGNVAIRAQSNVLDLGDGIRLKHQHWQIFEYIVEHRDRGFSMVEITPYHEGKVPYRAEEEEDSLLEIPELDLQYTPAATYPDPIWQRDSTQTEPEEE